MAVRDISDVQVLQAYVDGLATGRDKWPYELLAERSGQPEKVCYRACERAYERGLITYGVSLRAGWLTEDGEALLGRKEIDQC